jgi:hypothetical protein
MQRVALATSTPRLPTLPSHHPSLAARKIGAGPLIEGLKRVHGAAPAFHSYRRGEVLPLLNSGFLPPIAVLLTRRGWRMSALPGGPVRLEGAGSRLDPFGRMGALSGGSMTAEAWRALCAAAGIGELALQPATAEGSGSPQ